MQRRRFLTVPLALASSSVGLRPAGTAAQAVSQPVQQRAPTLLVRADADRDNRPFTWLDATFHVMVSGKDNAGRSVIFDTLRPEKVGPPLHLHTDCDEWFFVRSGTFKFQVGTETMHLGPGDSLLVAQDTPHAFVKTSEGVARLIVMHQPAATMEEYFRRVIETADRTVEGRRVLAERHGMRIVGEPLSPD
jgi:mannose-6-phosphate isomerase-like protein (cupin superfamily)